jgi:cytochrome c oxidase assembly factor CtaG
VDECPHTSAAFGENRRVSPKISWTFEPVVLIVVAAALWLYVPRWRLVRAQHGARGAGRWRLVSFLGGLTAVVAALISPIDSISDDLFFVHMIQHVLLLDIAPVLLICGQTKLILRPATRRLLRLEESVGWFGRPAFAVVFYVGAVWFWHIPTLYDTALRHPVVHVIEHISYAAAGGLYWWHLLSPIRSRHRLGGMGPAVYMAATKLCVGVLGIVLALAPGTLYGYYASKRGFWGLSPHSDQELAGGVMALEQSLVMGVALAVIFIRMLRDSEREARRADRLLDAQEAAAAPDPDSDPDSDPDPDPDPDGGDLEPAQPLDPPLEPGTELELTLLPGAEALEDPGVTGDRTDQDRPVGDLGAGEDDRLAQADAVAEGGAVADDDRPVETDVGADPDVVADPDRQ